MGLFRTDQQNQLPVGLFAQVIRTAPGTADAMNPAQAWFPLLFFFMLLLQLRSFLRRWYTSSFSHVPIFDEPIRGSRGESAGGQSNQSASNRTVGIDVLRNTTANLLFTISAVTPPSRFTYV